MSKSAATGLAIGDAWRRRYIAAVMFAMTALTPPCTAKGVGIELHPRNQQQLQASQLLIQGSQLLKSNEPFKARPLMERAATLWPEEPHVHFNLGACYTEMGDFPRAIAEYEQALRIDPTLTECLPDIATCYQLMNEYSRAIDYFKEYLRRNPHASDSAQVHGMIAALERQALKQVDSDPQNSDYLASVMKNGKLERWQRNRFPLKVFIANGTDEQARPATGFREVFNETLLQSLDKWVQASNYRLAYQLVDDARSADIVCSWTDRKDFLDKGTAVEQGAAKIEAEPVPDNPNEARIVRVHVAILVMNPNTGRPATDEEIKKTCLHELGHALGFNGHSNNNKDVMFYSESPTVWAALTKRDKNTMAKLYCDYPVFSWSTAGRPF